MVTHCRSNFIMLISNLPSVRSSRYKPNVGNRVIRFSFSPLLFRSSVTLCPSFVKYEHFHRRRRRLRCRRRPRRLFCWGFSNMYSHQDDGDDGESYHRSFPFLFLFVSVRRRFDSVYSFTWGWKTNEKKKGRTFSIKAMPLFCFYSLLSLSLPSSLQ